MAEPKLKKRTRKENGVFRGGELFYLRLLLILPGTATKFSFPVKLVPHAFIQLREYLAFGTCPKSWKLGI